MHKGVGTSGPKSLKVESDAKRALKAIQANAVSTREWAEASITNIQQYNAWTLQREPYSQRVRRWRTEGV
ncbi:MAG: hypothetical protein RL211_1230 [Pseudomonadota bacterium]|jgi:hypothetical protein